MAFVGRRQVRADVTKFVKIYNVKQFTSLQIHESSTINVEPRKWSAS
ncbi:Uncharacterised protein [Vibrio cholerae]|nr:Uncharacterised protein [Vibrio cholerae]